MIEQHTDEPGTCQLERIRALADLCDNEYYMSAAGPPVGSQERAKRGHNRIEQCLHELEALKYEVECLACRQEIDRQMMLQQKAIQEIEQVWGKQT